MTTEIATVEVEPAGTLAMHQQAWTPAQRATLAQIGVADAPEGDLAVFHHVCARTGLDPFARQIYMIPRSEGRGADKTTKWTIQTGIDGFRLVAARNPHYRGQTAPQWCGPDGVWVDVWLAEEPPAAARVGILRDDRDEPTWGVAMFREYAQTKTWDNVTRLTKMWQDKSAHMIAKCAEALAIRKAFPQDLAAVYSEDEMAHTDNPVATGRMTRVVDQPAPTAAELTGPAAAADRLMDQEQQREIFALIREQEIGNRLDYASGVLGREITSYGQVTYSDAEQLLAALKAQPTGQPS
ncbi:phage recombination protein Bet [Pseudonocardia pini]|uniref:phage recombination protein Bet n=1 Tax=Pseudonocardia pini TaxID=2758030 RepID=UPI0015F10912|nr:phage recombination protein Bet [Pseudonocardia pini]